jgi:hypothetical protein
MTIMDSSENNFKQVSSPSFPQQETVCCLGCSWLLIINAAQQAITGALLHHGNSSTNQRCCHGPLRWVRLINSQIKQEGSDEITEKEFYKALMKWNQFNIPLLEQEMTRLT